MRNKATLIIGLGLGLLLLSLGGTRAQQPKVDPIVNLPEGLRHVPPEGMAFVYVRTGAFLDSKIGQALSRELLGDAESKRTVMKLEDQLGMGMKDVESITLVLLEPVFSDPRFRGDGMKMPALPATERSQKKATVPDKLQDAPKPPLEEKKAVDSPVSLQQDDQFVGMEMEQHRSMGPAVFVVTANKPLDRKKMLKALITQPRKDHVQPVLFLSERSFAMGEPASLIRFADVVATTTTLTTKAGKEVGGGGFPGRNTLNTLQGAMALAKDNHVLVAGFRLPATLKRQLTAQMSMPLGRFAGPEITLFPLLNVAWSGLTVDLNQDKAEVHVQLKGRNVRGAELAAEAAKTGLTLLEIGLDNLVEKDQKSAAAWLGTIKKTLASVKVHRQGTVVGVDLNADFDPKVIKLAIAEITDKVKLSAGREISKNNLKQIALAMHNYHDNYKGFPPPALRDKNKNPGLSWRVAILPYIEQEQLYRQFKLDEPWDSEHNKKLIPLMPSLYADPRGKTKDSGMTYYQVFVGPGTAFEQMNRPGQGNIRIPNDIPDGTSNTIMAVEAGKPVIWTKPGDLPFDPKKALPKLGGLFPDGFHAALCDGSVRFIKSTVPASTLRLLIIRDDGNVIPDY